MLEKKESELQEIIRTKDREIQKLLEKIAVSFIIVLNLATFVDSLQ